MRVLVINLASDVSRMAFQREQMGALGLEWERLEAIAPDDLSVPPEDSRWQRWQRPLRAVEIAILESHYKAWGRVVAADAPLLIVEDDAMLAAEVPDLLRRLDDAPGCDHVTLEVRNRKKLVGGRHPTLPMRRLYQDRAGAAAYVLWPSGARVLRSRAALEPGLADAVISAAYAMNSWQAEPALAIQLDHCEAYGISAPLFTTSSVRKETRLRPKRSHRARRFAGQLRLGVRYLAKIAISKHRHIAPSCNWPILNAERNIGSTHNRPS